MKFDKLGRPRRADGAILPQNRRQKIQAKWDRLLSEGYAGKPLDDNQVIYRQVKEHKPEEIENITHHWIKFLRSLGKTQDDARALLPRIDEFNYSLTQCIVNQVVELDFNALVNRVLRFHPYPWQAHTLNLFEGNPHSDFALRIGRQGGKTRLCAVYGSAKAIQHEYPYRIGIISKSKDAAEEMFIHVSHAIETNDLLWWSVKRMTRSEIEFDTGSTIQVKPSGYRGAHFDILFLDEAAFQDDEKIEAIEPAIIAKQGRIIAISTPNGKKGWFYRKSTEPGDRTIKLYYPSSANPHIRAEDLEYKMKTKAEFWFRQEYLAEWVDWSGNAFTPQEITRIFQPEHNWHNVGTEGQDYFAGYDLGSSGTDESILIIGHKPKEHVVLDHYSEWGMSDYKDQIMGVYDKEGNLTRPGVTHILDAFHVRGMAMDTMGAGEGALGIFPREYTALIEPIKQSIQWHCAAYQSLKYYTERAYIYAPRQDPGHMKIEKQLIDLVMKTTEYGRRPTHPPNEHDDTYSALALMVHTYFAPNQASDMYAVTGTIPQWQPQ